MVIKDNKHRALSAFTTYIQTPPPTSDGSIIILVALNPFRTAQLQSNAVRSNQSRDSQKVQNGRNRAYQRIYSGI